MAIPTTPRNAGTSRCAALTSDLQRDSGRCGGGDEGVGLRLERLDGGEHAGPAGIVVGNTVDEVLVERRRDRFEIGDARVDRLAQRGCRVGVGGLEQRLQAGTFDAAGIERQ